MTKRDASLFYIFTAIACVTCLALHYGWLNDDALNYLTLADHLSQHKGFSLRPSWGDPYWAVFPAGYPLVIAAFKTLLGCDAFTASKIANGCLLAASILLSARWLKLPVLLTGAFFFSATLLEIASYSWSENLFIFAHILALASLAKYLESGRIAALLFYTAGLLLAASSRYIGGFMLAGYLALLVLAFTRYPHRRVIAAAVATLFCAAAFAAYLYINDKLTGFPTGMQRVPAPEPMDLLVSQFAKQLISCLWMLFIPFLMLRYNPLHLTRIRLREYPRAWPPVLLGILYLLILFVLRSTSRFEQFSFRLMAPGAVLIGLGLLHIAHGKWNMGRWRQGGGLYALALLGFLVNLAIVYQDFLFHPGLIGTESMDKGQQNYERRYGSLPDGTVIIASGYDNPTVSWHVISPVFSSDRILYALIDDSALTYPDYRAYLARLRYKEKPPVKYLFDFTEFGSIKSLNTVFLREKTNPVLAEWITRHFSPGVFVECQDCNAFSSGTP